MGVLDQAALDDAVAKAIAPIAQYLEDLGAQVARLSAVSEGDRFVLDQLAADLKLTRIAVTLPPRRHWWQRRGLASPQTDTDSSTTTRMLRA